VAEVPARGAPMARRGERAYREYTGVCKRRATQPAPGSPARQPRWGGGGCPARDLCDESLLRDTSLAWPGQALVCRDQRFCPPLVLSLSKDEPPAGLVVRQAHHERVKTSSSTLR